MKLEALQLGKRFSKEWIFRDFNFTFESGKVYAITGSNGSGKSTLLQTICGIIPASKGSVKCYDSSGKVEFSELYNDLSYVGPYQELIEEFTLKEIFDFHYSLKPSFQKLTFKEFIEFTYLEGSKNKYINNFSSGMKQRVKLALAYFTNSSIVCLDEPTVNLDAEGIEWYKKILESLIQQGRTVLICSNQPYEYERANDVVDINQYK